jgi:hypothetical protein
MTRKLLAAFVLSGLLEVGCSTKGYIKAENVAGVTSNICARHDAYVKADKRYDDPTDPLFGQRASDLRDSELLQKVIVEAQKK